MKIEARNDFLKTELITKEEVRALGIESEPTVFRILEEGSYDKDRLIIAERRSEAVKIDGKLYFFINRKDIVAVLKPEPTSA